MVRAKEKNIQGFTIPLIGRGLVEIPFVRGKMGPMITNQEDSVELVEILTASVDMLFEVVVHDIGHDVSCSAPRLFVSDHVMEFRDLEAAPFLLRQHLLFVFHISIRYS